MLSEAEVNRIAGKKLYVLRKTLGLSRAALAKEIGVTGQQVHKYESGINRLSADKLYRLAALFEVPPAAFFPEKDATQPHQPLPPASVRLIRIVNQISQNHQESLYIILRELTRMTDKAEQ